MKLKVYWVYGWSQYYPTSVLGDLQGTFYTFEEADEFRKSIADNSNNDGGTEIINVSRQLGIEDEPRRFWEDD